MRRSVSSASSKTFSASRWRGEPTALPTTGPHTLLTSGAFPSAKPLDRACCHWRALQAADGAVRTRWTGRSERDMVSHATRSSHRCQMKDYQTFCSGCRSAGTLALLIAQLVLRVARCGSECLPRVCRSEMPTAGIRMCSEKGPAWACWANNIGRKTGGFW
jgi:hypothetical protein